jgi:hypothetical protein
MERIFQLASMHAILPMSQGGVNHHDLANQMGTSISMIEQHYSHGKPAMIAEKLVGKINDAETRNAILTLIQNDTKNRL